MEHLYERLLELLTKRTTDPLFVQFLADIREQPLVEQAPGSFSYYRFLNFGFSLNIDADGKLNSALALIDNEATRAGFYKPFPQSLPYGIIPGDCCSDIESKLGVMVTHRSKGIHVLGLPPYSFFFRFDAQTGAVKSFMVMKHKLASAAAEK